ncbi:hypothetical protein EYF80_017878 [Liparis tanakae]|uniref:Uncharacterized protein n=1 Tax=Liparis tanakae TaxID=230148 RepID=A0A4Z2I271_9TELE|nr:hypothetical protein EYF80_017878 [Liparis tanakae]
MESDYLVYESIRGDSSTGSVAGITPAWMKTNNGRRAFTSTVGYTPHVPPPAIQREAGEGWRGKGGDGVEMYFKGCCRDSTEPLVAKGENCTLEPQSHNIRCLTDLLPAVQAIKYQYHNINTVHYKSKF